MEKVVFILLVVFIIIPIMLMPVVLFVLNRLSNWLDNRPVRKNGP